MRLQRIQHAGCTSSNPARWAGRPSCHELSMSEAHPSQWAGRPEAKSADRACSASSTVGRKSGELAAACTAASAFIRSAAHPSASVRTCGAALKRVEHSCLFLFR